MQIVTTFESFEEMVSFARKIMDRERKSKSVELMENLVEDDTEAMPEPVEVLKEEAVETKEEPPITYTLMEVRAELARLSKEGKKAQVQELIRSFGTDKLSKIPEDKYPEVMKKAGEL